MVSGIKKNEHGGTDLLKVLVLVVECDVVLILAGPFGLVDGDGLRFGNFRGIAQLVHLHTQIEVG
jgi:hypothetical protein